MIGLTRSPKFQVNKETHIKVVAAIPCLNTERTITDVVTRAKKYVNEVVVIDDGSSDRTAEIARRAGAIVISHDWNRGKGAAMETAMANIDTDILVFIDGDGQHDPSDIPKLLTPIILGDADFVIGSRYLNESMRSSNPLLRRGANLAASYVISFIISVLQPMARFVYREKLPQRRVIRKQTAKVLGYRVLDGRFKWITDCTSGFTAMRKESCSKLNLISSGFQIETEMIFEQAKHGFIIAEVPISCKWGESVSKLSIIKDGSKTLGLLMKKLICFSKTRNYMMLLPMLSIVLAASSIE